MTTIEYLDRPPTGWFVLDVMRCQARKRDWVALMIDIDPDCPDWRDGSRRARNAFVRVPGKHRKGCRLGRLPRLGGYAPLNETAGAVLPTAPA